MNWRKWRKVQYLKPTKRYYFDLRDENGTVRRIRGFADLKATEQLAADMSRKVERRQCGYADPAEEHIRRPLAEHLKDYAAHLEAKGNTSDHFALSTGRVAALLSGCGFVFTLDSDAGRAAEWLNSLRRNGTPVELPAGESFTPGNAATLLGISGAAVRAAVKRLNLTATGNGKARSLPRSTVETRAEPSEGTRAGNDQPLHPRRAWLLPLAREGEANRTRSNRSPS